MREALRTKYTTIYTNFTLLNIPKNKEVKELTTDILFDRKLKNALILIDEIYTWLESRKSQHSVNTLFSYLLFQARKKNIKIIGTIQQLFTLDIRYREFIGCLINAEVRFYGFKYTYYRFKNNKLLKPYSKKLSFQNAKKYYKYYKTEEPVNPLQNYNPFDKKLADFIVLKIKMVFEESGLKITRPSVFNVCRKSQISDSQLIEYIYVSIKHPEIDEIINRIGLDYNKIVKEFEENESE